MSIQKPAAKIKINFGTPERMPEPETPDTDMPALSHGHHAKLEAYHSKLAQSAIDALKSGDHETAMKHMQKLHGGEQMEEQLAENPEKQDIKEKLMNSMNKGGY